MCGGQPPRVSVILPAYNGAAHIGAAIDSILSQSFRDFELIVIDDGSTDATGRIVAGYDDPRIHYLHQSNQGLAATLNRGLDLARGAYIARQDHDDISLPDRLAKQVAFLDAHADVVLLGTHAEIRPENGVTRGLHRHPAEDAALRFELLFDNPFVHSSVMMRRDAVRAVGGYCADPARQPEDYELWSRLAQRGKIANLPETLLIYREVTGSITRRTSFRARLAALCAENLSRLLERDSAERDIRDIAALLHRVPGRLSLWPRLSQMQALVVDAARIIQTSSPQAADFSPKIREINDRLARRFIMYSFNPLRFLHGTESTS